MSVEGVRRAFVGITKFAPILLLQYLGIALNETTLMNVSLTPELEKFVAAEVEGGLYQTASEVIRAGLRRLKEEKERRPLPRTLGELEADLLRSVERLDRGQGVDGETAFRRLRQRIKERRDRG